MEDARRVKKRRPELIFRRLKKMRDKAATASRWPELFGVSSSFCHNIPTEPQKDYIIWSLFNLVNSNPCCLGLAALIYSIKARDRRVVGDLDGARHFASTARCLNIWATILVVLSVSIAIITVIAVTVMAAQAANSYSSYNSYNSYGGYIY